MKRISTGFIAASVGLSFMGASLIGAEAAPFPFLNQQGTGAEIQQVQYRGDHHDRRVGRPGPARGVHARGFERRGNLSYYNGHQGYREYRRGYRQYNGVWFPPSAFLAGAIIGGAIASQPPVVMPRPAPVQLSAAHVAWCQDRWRSYRVSDNSFQPLNGPRQLCASPYRG